MSGFARQVARRGARAKSKPRVVETMGAQERSTRVGAFRQSTPNPNGMKEQLQMMRLAYENLHVGQDISDRMRGGRTLGRWGTESGHNGPA